MKTTWIATLIIGLLSVAVYTQAQHNASYENELPESARLLSRYIQIPSVSGDEHQAGEYLADVCREKGFYVETFPGTEDSGFNFAASLYPLEKGKPNIIFLNHIDVVPAGSDSLWTYPAYSGTIADGKVWGRGVLDMKGMTIMQLLALEELSSALVNELPYNVTLLCVSREEVDNGGAKTVAEQYCEYLNPIVMFGEGGAGIRGLSSSNPDHLFFTVSVAEKKALWLKLILEIPSSGHGSVPPLQYTNQVIVKALSRLVDHKTRLRFDETTGSMFQVLGKHERGIKKTVLSRPRLFKFLLTPTVRREPILMATLTNTITVTNLSNPVLASNQIAQEVQVMLDCRLLPGTDKDQFITSLKKVLKCDEINFTITQETPSAAPSRPGEFYQMFKDAIISVHPGSSVIPTLFPAYSDNTYFRNKGVPVYGINPVYLSLEQLKSVHNFNEHISIEELEKGKRVYFTFLKSIAGQQEILARQQ